MTADYPVDDAPATPEYVFWLFRQVVLLRSPWPPPAVAYEAVADEPAHRGLGYLCSEDLEWGLDDVFGINIPHAELAALGLLDRRTVREVCEFVAARITRPVIRPWRHIAGECLPAGAFLTVRSMLAARGADPDRITPGTPLTRYVRRYAESLLPGLARLAPDRVPAVKERFPLWGFLCVLFAPLPLFLVLLLAEWGIKVPVWVFEVAVYGGAPFTVIGIGLMIREVLRPRLGDLVTFRDLACCLAGQQPRRAIQPTS